MHYVQTQCCIFVYFCSRPPHGGRGLKCDRRLAAAARRQSPSTRRAWIEIFSKCGGKTRGGSRPPHGGRGLKFKDGTICPAEACRPPHGGRGLKCPTATPDRMAWQSPSTRRAWIEIVATTDITLSSSMSPSTRRAWIEMPG